MLTGVLTGVLIAIVVLGDATESGASTRKGHAGKTPTVCATKRQMLNLNKFVFLVGNLASATFGSGTFGSAKLVRQPLAGIIIPRGEGSWPDGCD